MATKSQARRFATVRCEKHGHQDVKGIPDKSLKVGMPTTKNARKFGGCPFCKKERAA